jgi:hypothetical protein
LRKPLSVDWSWQHLIDNLNRLQEVNALKMRFLWVKGFVFLLV